MKILIQIPQLIFGGAEKVLVSFANDLVMRGHEVLILETYERGLLKPQFDKRVKFDAVCSNAYTEKYYASLDNVKSEKNILHKITKCFKLVFSKAVGYRRFAEKLTAKRYKNCRFDVAVNFLEIDSPQFLLENISADKYIQWYHTDVANLDNPEETDALIPWFEKMNAIICVAKSAKNNFTARYPQLKEKTHTLYNFFDKDAICEKANEKFSFQSEVPVLLSVGRMTAQKKYLRFLDVLAKLKNTGFKFEWHVLGTGVEFDKITQKIEKLNLSDSVFLDGVAENPYKYMKNCDLFVLPSGWEGFPTVTIEAKVLGCPVLATDVSGIREQLVHGETGWIVENSEQGIYEGLKFLLEHPETAAKIRSDSKMESICNNDEKYSKFMKICEGK